MSAPSGAARWQPLALAAVVTVIGGGALLFRAMRKRPVQRVPLMFPADADEALGRLQRNAVQAIKSAELATLLLKTDGSMKVKWIEVAQRLLAVDARTGEPLVSLSHVVEGKGSLLMVLIGALKKPLKGHANDDMKTLVNLEKDVQAALRPAITRVCALIRSSYDVNIRHNGWDALGSLTSDYFFAWSYNCDWMYELAEALLDRGCNVNARGPDGEVLLVRWARNFSFAKYLLLLLERGADINAQNDSDGFNVLHALAERGSVFVLQPLVNAGWLFKADRTLRSHAGETALQIAQRKMVDNPSAYLIEAIELLSMEPTFWRVHVRPRLCCIDPLHF